MTIFLKFYFILLIIVAAVGQEDEEKELSPEVQNLKEIGANYLQNVIEKLQQERDEGQSLEVLEMANLNMDRVSEPTPDNTMAPSVKMKQIVRGVITAPTPNPPLQVEFRPVTPTAPALTADELKAIYNAALAKGVSLSQLQNSQAVNPFVHQPASNNQQDSVIAPINQGVVGNGAYPGYYYYFYPIKSFVKGMQSPQASDNSVGDEHSAPSQLNIASMANNLMDNNNNKSVEPLFMAVTGFVGMALMFIVSVLFLPKFGHIRSGDMPELKEAPNELAVLGKLVIESMDGKDCTERIACELGRFARNMKLEKTLKVMEIVLPPNMGRQIGLVRKAAGKRERCNFIPCRFKSSRPPAKTDVTEENWKKGQSPHDLWMKHFQKEKNKGKHPANVWVKKA